MGQFGHESLWVPHMVIGFSVCHCNFLICVASKTSCGDYWLCCMEDCCVNPGRLVAMETFCLVCVLHVDTAREAIIVCWRAFALTTPPVVMEIILLLLVVVWSLEGCGGDVKQQRHMYIIRVFGIRSVHCIIIFVLRCHFLCSMLFSRQCS